MGDRLPIDYDFGVAAEDGTRAVVRGREVFRVDPCVWTEDEDGCWVASCDPKRGLFVFDADGPVANRFRFCPYCGGPLSEVRHPEPADLTDEDHGGQRPAARGAGGGRRHGRRGTESVPVALHGRARHRGGTLMSADTRLHIPATRELLDGWTGPVVFDGYETVIRWFDGATDVWIIESPDGDGYWFSPTNVDNWPLRLDLSRAECRDRAARVTKMASAGTPKKAG